MGVVVSVNVGLPRDIEWRGKTVRTAIWKQPVQGRVFAGRLNLAGDGQGDLAGHGGEQRALMVYQRESYRHWADYFRRNDLVDGIFGENLTIDGLADTEVCIGDRFRIGGAVFEISQPRVTCYKVGLRLNNPEMPALLVSHRRPGFYFRVIQEGEIGAGDQIEKIADGPERMTVAEIDALLYSGDHPIDALRRAVRIPALSPGWQGSINSLLAAAEDGNFAGNAGLTSVPAAPLSWHGFRSLKIVASNLESADVRSFEFGTEDGTPLPPALPGQYIVVRLRPNPDGPTVARNYSLCGALTAGTYRIAVKNEGGLASGFLHAHIHAGDRLEVSAPRGSFTLATATTPLVLLSAGVGVTPMLGMLYGAAATDCTTPREVWWVHSARDGGHHSFAPLARDMVGMLTRGHLHTIYSRPGPGDRLGIDYDKQGHLSVPLLQQMGVPRDGDFYLCGPAGFLEDMQAGLKAWGVETSRIHVEAFGPAPGLTPGVVGAGDQAPHLPDGPQGSGPMVTFARSGLAVHWDARFNNLLELAEACAIPVRWSCRTGVCHNCESGLIDGQLRYAPEPLDPPADGNALICCATPISPVELDL
jgi:ferredoxin-NADP reductase/MOSC domain-containing protein YiiM